MSARIDASSASSSRFELDRLLAVSPLLGDAGGVVRRRLLGHVSMVRLKPREPLYSQGQPGHSVYELIEGSMKLVHHTGGARGHVVRLARAGEVLAETVLFSRRAYSATAIALEDSSLLAVDAGELSRCLREIPALAWRVMQRLGERIDELQAQTEILATHTAEQKVAAYLMSRYRARPPGGALVGSGFRQSDLAGLLALAPETLCRVIAGFKRRGWVRSDHGRIVILDAEGLSTVSP